MKVIFLEQGISVLRNNNWESKYWTDSYPGKYCVQEDSIMEGL